MKTVRVEASRSYDVIIENGGINSCGDYIGGVFKGKRLMVVSDDIVFPIYGERVIKSLEASGFTVESFVIPNGEGSKSLSRYESLLDSMLMFRMTRSDGLVALGGGVVGDLTGCTPPEAHCFWMKPAPSIPCPPRPTGWSTATTWRTAPCSVR